MTAINSPVSTCRHCQHYLVEGRRGGQCKQLGAPVLGRWKACQLAIPPFAPSWEDMTVTELWGRQSSDTEPGIIPSYTLEALEACMQSEVGDMDKSVHGDPSLKALSVKTV